jgi:hypothetical protein
MSYKEVDAPSSVALEYLRRLRQLEKEIYDLEVEKGRAEHTVKSLEKSKEELEKQASGKTHSDREQEQEKLLLLEINKSLRNSTEELERSTNELEKKFYEQNKTLKELTQEKAIVTEVAKHLRNTVSDLEKSKEELEKQVSEKTHSDREREQERLLRLEVNRILLNKIEELQKSKDHLEKKINGESKSLRELKQERLILSEIATSERTKSKKIYKKYYLSIAIIASVITAAFVGYSHYQNELVLKTTTEILANLKSKYVIQNLKGDTIDTWIAWNIIEGRTLYINIINSAGLSDDKIESVKQAIFSSETIDIDDSVLQKRPAGVSSTYYLGWKGALDSIQQQTEFVIPSQFQVLELGKGQGDITIDLTKLKDGDGLSGYTNSIADGNQILKTHITIYQADMLTNEQLAAITRHEFGHVLGLAHSTAPEDLMHDTIQMSYPYISSCDIDAATELYDGKKTSKVVCEE